MTRIMTSRSLLSGLAAAFSLSCQPAWAATTHALIMSISKYQGSIPELAGVKFDAAKAARIAEAMGVDPANIRYLRDDQVTAEGIDLALNQLYERIQPGDQVFVYYSGHGGRLVVLDPEPRCAEALVSVTGDPYVDNRLEQQLRRLSAKAGKIVAFLDACHSGGVTTRSIGSKSAFRPKSWNKGDAEVCVKPVNVITRSLARAAPPGSGAGNYVYIAAARSDEIALDSSQGGIATNAWSECIAGAAIDKDGSGGLSAQEIQECAQRKIEQVVRGSKEVLPHHVTITGNANTVLSFPKSPPVSSPTPFPPQVSTVAATAVSPAISMATVATGPAATLSDLFSNRDDRRRVDVLLDKSKLKIGADRLAMTVTSTHPGHVYVLMAGSDGKSFDLLFPNQLDRNNQMDAGTPMILPRPSWNVVVQGPEGIDRLLVIVADAPRDFKSLSLQPAGPFSMVEASPANAKDIQLVFGGNNKRAACKDQPGRTDPAGGCATAYGAALVSVEEVR